ncbi:immunoglobulin mu heavy chain-like [Chiloscyllium punctatum]|uniref:immunoglobulin mu heavy chain-like n=1 Tax=Chiloscyllium punctatum TaxID=137246 RepID=UPI003B6405C9
MSVTEGESVSLECRFARKTDDRYLVWGWVPPGSGAIQHLLYWSPGSRTPNYVHGSSARLRPEKDFARKTMRLGIARTRPQDASRYFCQLSDSMDDGNVTDFCGCGTTLTVQKEPPASPPSVELHSPPSGPTRAIGNATLLCLVAGYYPLGVDISWNLDGVVVSSGVSQSPGCQDAKGSYTTVSRVEVPTPIWMGAHRYQCRVRHSTLSQPIVKELHTLASVSLRRPSLRVIPPSIREMVTKRTATLHCVATLFIPEPITFLWKAPGLEIPRSSQSLVPTANEDGSYSARSELTLAREDWEAGTSYTCQLANAQSDPISTTLRVEDANLWKQPSVQTLVIETEDEDEEGELPGRGNTTLACFVSGFYPGDVYLSWRSQGRELSEGVTTFPVTPDPHGTFHTVSQLSVPSRDWHSGYNFTCLVGHQALEGLKETQLRKDSASVSVRRPSLRVIPPSIREMVTKRTATLHCVATLFIPEPITFLWKAQGLEMPGSSRILVPTANEDGSYSARSELTLTREDWEAGTSYTCQLANAQSDPISTTLHMVDAQLWKQPSVQTLVIETEDEDEEGELPGRGNTTLACFVSGFYPGDVYLSWRSQGRELSEGVTTFPVTPDPHGTFHTVSQLSVPSRDWHSGYNFTCLVGHQALEGLKETQLRKDSASVSVRRPSLRAIPPSIREMVTKRTATLHCVATLFIPEPITFLWKAQGLEMPGSSRILVPTANEDGSYSARSELTLSREDWEAGTSYTCQLANAQSDPISTTLHVADAQLWKQPSVQTLVIEMEDEDEEGELPGSGNTTLACFVSGFYPGDVYLSWRSQGRELSEGVTTFPVTPDPHGTFHTVSQLSVPSRDWHSGYNFTCLVGHQALKGLKETQLRKDSGWMEILRKSPWLWGSITVSLIILCIALATLTGLHCGRKRKGHYQPPHNTLWATDLVPLKEVAPSEEHRD